MNRTPQSIAAVLLWLALPGLDAQTKVDLRTQGKGVDFSQASATAPFKTGSTLPATCQIGEMFFKADAAAGQNMFGCTSANTWTQQAGSGGGGAPSAPEDFRPAVSVNTLTTSAGVARIGHQKYAIAAGGVQFSAGSGDCKTFISEMGVLTTHCAPGISGTATGSMVLAIVTTPAYPSGAIPVADLTVSSGTVTLDSDDRAFLSTRAIQAGAGISITDSSGVLSVATDSAIVPTLAGPNVFTGENDFSASTKFRVRTGSGPPSEATCDEAAEVGGIYIRNDAGTTNASHYICSKTGASTYAWELTQGAGGGGGSGLGDPGANGMVARTALNTTAARTITGTANKIAVRNGSGVAGDPTLSIGSDVVDKTAATTYTPGAKQTFQASASTAGANASCAALPSAPAAGDIACDSGDGNQLKQYNGSGWVTLAQGIVDPGAGGVLARTTLNTTAARTITGTANEITVTDGSGVAGDPTLSLSATFDVSGKTSTKPAKSGTSLPGTCTVGEQFFKTDATAGQNLYFCTALNTWSQMTGGSGAPTGAQYLTLANDAGLTAERLLDPRDGLTATDGGANGSYTIDNTADSSIAILQEEFCGGTTSAGHIGSLGWRMLAIVGGGSVDTNVNGVTNHPCLIKMDTGTSANGGLTVYLGPGFAYQPYSDWQTAEFRAEFIFRFTAVPVNKIAHAGLFNTNSANPSTRVGIRYYSASDTNWQFEACNSSTCTAIDSGVAAANTNWVRLVVYRNSDDAAAQFRLCLNACSSPTQITTNGPTTGISPGFIYVNDASGTNSQTMTPDWFGLKIRGLTRW